MRAKPRRRASVAAPEAKADDFSADVAGAWATLSPFKTETGIAVERFRIMVQRGLEPEMVFYAIATLAAQRTDTYHLKAPYHAVAFTEVVARTYIGRIREIMRDVRRDEERSGERPRNVGRGMHHIAQILRKEMP